MVPDTDGGWSVTETEQHDRGDLAQWQRKLAPMAFNRAWELLDRNELSIEEEEEMLSAAFAQRYHWYEIGDARNRSIADWQISRVAAVLGYADLARRFGFRALEVAQAHNLGPFLEGFAHEAIARAAAVVDDVETFTEHLSEARALVGGIEDEDERSTLEADLSEMSGT
jgi:hypothetical protein